MSEKNEAIVEEAAAQGSEEAVQTFIRDHANALNITQLQLIWATYYGVSPLGITMIQNRGHVNQQGISEKWSEHMEEMGYEFEAFQLRDLAPGTHDIEGKPHRVVGYDTYIAVRTADGALKEVGTKDPLIINDQLIPTGEPGWAAYSDSPVGRNQKSRPGGSGYSEASESLAYLKMHAATRARLRGKKALLLMDGKSLPTLAEEMDIETLFGGTDVVPLNNASPSGGVSAPAGPGEVLVPFKRAKEMFGGNTPTVAQLWEKDKGYCQWMIQNVTDNSVGDAMREFLAGKSMSGMDGSVMFREVRKSAPDYKVFMDTLIENLDGAGFDTRKKRKDLLESLFEKPQLEDCTLEQVRTLNRFAAAITGGMEEDAARKMIEATNVDAESSAA